MELRLLTEDDISAAMELSVQAGWNQIPADWRRLVDLAPDGCFSGWIDGELVATATLITYGAAVGWIGMVLVDEDHRRNGYGTAMFERVLDIARDRGVEVGLDATDAGREVYRHADFVGATTIERWSGELSPVGGDVSATACSVDSPTAAASLRSLDRRACGVDRSALLDHLLDEDGVTGLAVGDEIRGYAIVRPGREYDHIGPIVAPSRKDVAVLLRAAADVVEGDVLVDLIRADTVGGLLEEMGLRRQRRLTRMTYRESVQLLGGDDVVAAAGFELG